MRSEIRRPGHINLDHYVERVDARLRDEVKTIRRISLPRSFTKALRALKIRAMALLQGGAMALTAVAVMVAFGAAPALKVTVSTTGERPTVTTGFEGSTSALLDKGAGRLMVAVGGEPIVLAAPSPGVIE
jgi:hypothetical protein